MAFSDQMLFSRTSSQVFSLALPSGYMTTDKHSKLSLGRAVESTIGFWKAAWAQTMFVLEFFAFGAMNVAPTSSVALRGMRVKGLENKYFVWLVVLQEVPFVLFAP
jgi:hypothetical protein